MEVRLLILAWLGEIKTVTSWSDNLTLRILQTTDKVFAIPQQQIAEVFCDALLYYFRKHIITNTSVMFTSGSASICDIYANVFQRKFDRPPLFPPTAPVKMTDDEAIQHYGATQRQIYNNAGSESLQTTLFDIFCSLERTFSRVRYAVQHFDTRGD
jgi:hypothetical protein